MFCLCKNLNNITRGHNGIKHLCALRSVCVCINPLSLTLENTFIFGTTAYVFCPIWQSECEWCALQLLLRLYDTFKPSNYRNLFPIIKIFQTNSDCGWHWATYCLWHISPERIEESMLTNILKCNPPSTICSLRFCLLADKLTAGAILSISNNSKCNDPTG